MDIEIIPIKRSQLSIPNRSYISNCLTKIFAKYKCNPIATVINKIFKESIDHKRASISFDSIPNINEARKDLAIILLDHLVKKVIKSKVVRHIFDHIPQTSPFWSNHTNCFRYKTGNIHVFYDNYYHIVDTDKTILGIENAFVPEFMHMLKLNLSSTYVNIYYITEDDKIYAFNHDKECTFINYLNKCSTVDKAIVECNYFTNTNRIIELVV